MWDTGSSPHTRGARRLRHGDRTRARIIPAYAGSTFVVSSAALRSMDHPRIRGEHRELGELGRHFVGSSPHTRGARLSRRAGRRRYRIIPAYAGSTEANSLDGQTMADHPRIRGEHAERRGSALDFEGSSPHTRGARVLTWAMNPCPGIIPAYAGSTACSPPAASSPRDHPRIRGEHEGLGSEHGLHNGSSPHTRGARC